MCYAANTQEVGQTTTLRVGSKEVAVKVLSRFRIPAGGAQTILEAHAGDFSGLDGHGTQFEVPIVLLSSKLPQLSSIWHRFVCTNSFSVAINSKDTADTSHLSRLGQNLLPICVSSELDNFNNDGFEHGIIVAESQNVVPPSGWKVVASGSGLPRRLRRKILELSTLTLRKHLRIATFIDATIASESLGNMACFVLDISEGGVRLQTVRELPTLQTCTLQMSLSRASDKPEYFEAEVIPVSVRHSEKDAWQVAARFDNLSMRNRRIVRRYVDRSQKRVARASFAPHRSKRKIVVRLTDEGGRRCYLRAQNVSPSEIVATVRKPEHLSSIRLIEGHVYHSQIRTKSKIISCRVTLARRTGQEYTFRITELAPGDAERYLALI